ncbi:MAG: antibiotic resistance protein VanZ, partial [Prevotella sp.]|nr:antibiotic resistance protein VanZ [Prevotella sp.]
KQGLRLTDKFFKSRTMLLGWLAPVLMSGLIELLRAYCTGGRRSGEWLDFAANSIGVTLALFIGFVITQIKR